tara:strand:+ start:165 stop:533 length:369 start_codon:yes stop_codon:yes gene_type:complete
MINVFVDYIITFFNYFYKRLFRYYNLKYLDNKHENRFLFKPIFPMPPLLPTYRSPVTQSSIFNPYPIYAPPNALPNAPPPFYMPYISYRGINKRYRKTLGFNNPPDVREDETIGGEFIQVCA